MTLHRPGDKMTHVPSETRFTIEKLIRQRSTGRLHLVVGKDRYPADECVFEKLPWMETAMSIVEAILAGEESIEMLSALEPEHKAELWARLTDEQKGGLKQLGGKRNAA